MMKKIGNIDISEMYVQKLYFL